MTDGTWAEGVEKFDRVRAMKRLAAQTLAEEEREFARGGVVHALTAPQAAEYLQAVKDKVLLDYCGHCGQRIRVMINRGTGWCSEQCRKALADE